LRHKNERASRARFRVFFTLSSRNEWLLGPLIYFKRVATQYFAHMKQHTHFKIVYSGLYYEICPENLIHSASHKTHAKLHFQFCLFVLFVCLFVRGCVCVCVCLYVVRLFSWRYNPLWLYFHSPVAGFSLLVFARFLDNTQRRTTVGRTPLNE
jgi:hypothetical protein